MKKRTAGGARFGLMADEAAWVVPGWVSTDASGTRPVTERATTALMVGSLRDRRAERRDGGRGRGVGASPVGGRVPTLCVSGVEPRLHRSKYASRDC